MNPGVAVLNGRIHLVGGRSDGGAPGDYHRIYDIVADQWFQARGPRDPRFDHASVVVGGRLYVLTGVPGQQQDPTADVVVFGAAIKRSERTLGRWGLCQTRAFTFLVLSL